MTIEEFRKTTPNTETVETLVSVYLQRLERGEVEPSDQLMAATVLGEAIRRARNTAKAAQETARILAVGLERERIG